MVEETRVEASEAEAIPILGEDVPVIMPEIPLRLYITTVQQFKAMSDPLRIKILGVIRHQPATAKQLADRLGATPGTVGHHLHVLEAAGLAQVVARRVVRGIVAKYYTRTARIFNFDLLGETVEEVSINTDILKQVYEELTDAIASAPASEKETVTCMTGFPHARLSKERIEAYSIRLDALIEDFLSEPVNAEGEVYGLSVALFKSPPYLQSFNEDESSPVED